MLFAGAKISQTQQQRRNEDILRIHLQGYYTAFLWKYEAYSESKYHFAVKKKSIQYKILLFSDSTFFKLFFHIFAAIIEALIVAGHKFL